MHNKMSAVLLVLIGLMSSTLAHINLHGEPLLSAVTSFTLTVTTTTLRKSSTCYITIDAVTQCRRKRGIEESPIQYNDNLEIAPSAVYGIEATPVPRNVRSLDLFNGYPVSSSMDDSFQKYQNIFKQLAAKGRHNVVSVGDCGMSTVNFSEFLNCLGMTVQETTTLTATFTETYTSFSDYNTMTIAGCTPAGFPYSYCPENDVSTTTADSVSP